MAPSGDPPQRALGAARCEGSRAVQFLARLRDADPSFAAASVLHPDDMSEWQAAVYLLTGCESVWRAVGAAVLGDRTIAPVVDELADPRRAWSASETEVMAWAAHLWDVDRFAARFPYVFERSLFDRWIVACHLRKGLALEARFLFRRN
jgi:hypothetical protein